MDQFKRPENGICVDAECRGNPGVSRFQLYDLSENKIIAVGEKFYATNNIAEFMGLVNSIHYCLKHGIDNLFTDSMTAMSWAFKAQFRSNLARNQRNDKIRVRANKGIKYLKTLKYNSNNDSFTADNGNTVFVHKWLTSEWGEIPADFGNKSKYSKK